MVKKEEVKKYSKADFVSMVAKQTGLTKVDSNKAVDAFVESVTHILSKGDEVSFIGFGKFSVGERAARIGRNPQTGTEIKIKASKVARFGVGQKLKDAVNGK